MRFYKCLDCGKFWRSFRATRCCIYCKSKNFTEQKADA